MSAADASFTNPWSASVCTLGLATISGAFAALSRSSGHFASLALWSVLPFCAALLAASAQRPPTRRVLNVAAGLSFGAVENLVLLWELPRATAQYFGVGPRRALLAVSLLGGVHAMRHAVWALSVSEITVRRGSFAWAASVGYVAWSAAWPRLGQEHLAAGLSEVPVFRFLPALGGPQLSEFVLVALSALLAQRLVPNRAPRFIAGDRALLALCSALLCAAFGFGMWVERSPQSMPLHIAVVQPNRPVYDDDAPRADAALFALSARATSRAKVDLVVWPESALVGRLPPDPRAALAQRLGRVAQPLLFGADLRMHQGDAIYGSALLVEAGGKLRARYDKKGLMPFAEQFPLLSLIPASLVKRWQLPHAQPGTRHAVFELSGIRYGVLICYEDLLPTHLFQEFRGDVPDVLISLVNDGWFGRGAMAYKHEAHARVRASEWARPLVRVSQSGITAWFGPDGARRESLPGEREASAVFRIPLTRVRTPFSMLGPWPGPAAWIALALWFWRARRKRVPPA